MANEKILARMKEKKEAERLMQISLKRSQRNMAASIRLSQKDSERAERDKKN